MNIIGYLLDDNRGVSPVIGVILMVAITVILAAVIATFVMNMGPETNQPANAQWDGSFEDPSGGIDSFTLTHEGGSSASPGEYVLSVEDSGDSDHNGDYNLKDDLGRSNDLSASDSVTFEDADTSDADGDLDLTAATVQLIWEDPEGDQTQIIQTWEP